MDTNLREAQRSQDPVRELIERMRAGSRLTVICPSCNGVGRVPDNPVVLCATCSATKRVTFPWGGRGGRLHLLAYCGDPSARELLGWEVIAGPVDINDWLTGLKGFPPTVWRKAVIAVGWAYLKWLARNAWSPSEVCWNPTSRMLQDAEKGGPLPKYNLYQLNQVIPVKPIICLELLRWCA